MLPRIARTTGKIIMQSNQHSLKFFDVAVNLADPQFTRAEYNHQVGRQSHTPDLALILHRARLAGVRRVLITGTTLQESREALEMARGNSSTDNGVAENESNQSVELYSTVGCHPTRCLEFQESPDAYWEGLKQLASDGIRDGKVLAIGECGLDYDRLQHCHKDVQIRYFRRQLELAHELDMPLFLHNRNTGGDFVRVLREFSATVGALSGIVHSFDGPADELTELVSMGFFVGLNGCSMKTAENLKVIRDHLPLNRLVLETDAPWCELRPTHASWPVLQAYQRDHLQEMDTKDDHESWRADAVKKEKFQLGKRVKGRNEPCMIRQVAQVVAQLHGVCESEVARYSYENAARVLRLPLDDA